MPSFSSILCLQFDNVRNKNADGMPLIMLLGGMVCGMSWLVFGLLLNDPNIYVSIIPGTVPQTTLNMGDREISSLGKPSVESKSANLANLNDPINYASYYFEKKKKKKKKKKKEEWKQLFNWCLCLVDAEYSRTDTDVRQISRGLPLWEQGEIRVKATCDNPLVFTVFTPGAFRQLYQRISRVDRDFLLSLPISSNFQHKLKKEFAHNSHTRNSQDVNAQDNWIRDAKFHLW